MTEGGFQRFCSTNFISSISAYLRITGDSTHEFNFFQIHSRSEISVCGSSEPWVGSLILTRRFKFVDNHSLFQTCWIKLRMKPFLKVEAFRDEALKSHWSWIELYLISIGQNSLINVPIENSNIGDWFAFQSWNWENHWGFHFISYVWLMMGQSPRNRSQTGW